MKLVFNLSIGLLLLVQLGLYLFGSGLMPLALWPRHAFFVAFISSSHPAVVDFQSGAASSRGRRWYL